eukprot:TRINITY_DN11915_c0_g1_i7.p2 TRINITY_DN11915_c0_g1~~TRINITY_DN11915_c0_g1_i7.p2  ORF type:complete len:212 (+),score=26.87 TRINITY_DN11915_c0_g1_i7:178-813(+)
MIHNSLNVTPLKPRSKARSESRTPVTSRNRAIVNTESNLEVGSDKKSFRQPSREERIMVMKALREKFKDIYDNSGKKSRSRKVTRAKTPDISIASPDTNPSTTKPKDAPLFHKNKQRSRSVISSQCSQCSGSYKKNMGYACINCENKELAEYRRERANKEKAMNEARDRRRLEEFLEKQAKREEELKQAKRQKASQLQEEIQRAQRKKTRE